MKPIQIIAQDLFDKVRSRFTNLEMGDETGAVTIDPAEARFFDFDFVNEGVNLGRVSISLNDLGSLKIYYSQGITENQDDVATQMWFNFLKEMRLFSMRRLLRFDTRDIAKNNLDKNDFQHLAATQGPKEEPDMNENKKTKNNRQAGAINENDPLNKFRQRVQSQGFTDSPEERNADRLERKRRDNEKLDKMHANFMGREPSHHNFAAREPSHHNFAARDADQNRWDREADHASQQRMNRDEYNTQRRKDDDEDTRQTMDMMRDRLNRMQYRNQRDVDPEQLAAISNVKYEPRKKTEGSGQAKTDDKLLAYYAKLKAEKQKQQGVTSDEQTMNESRWNHKSSSKTSRAVQGKTEVIVRHAKAVEETYPGARSQSKNIKAIFIQNHDGERFKYPFIHTAGAFAMAQHVDHGGVPHDPAGKAIIKMSENIAKLGEFQRHIQRSSLHADAHGIAERAIGHMNELKARVAALGKRHHYQAWREDFEMSGMGDNTEETMLDDVTLEDYKSKFTQTNFQEELTSFFPLLHSIMSETNAVDLESYVSEATCSKCHCDPCECDDNEEKVKESAFEQFEEWAEATEQGKLTDDQIMELKQALGDLQASGNPLQLGPNGQTAIQFFSELGLDDADLKDKLEAATQLDPAGDGVEIMKLWAQESYPELLVALGMSGTGEEQPPEAAPPAPEVGAAPEQPVAEGKSSMVQEVAKIVKSFYNADNESVGPFRAEENIALDCKKQISEKFGEKAGEQAYEMAEAFINKLTQEWQQKHGHIQKHSPVDQGDGFSIDRLKELVGNIKTKVEGMGQPEMEEKDDWHPSKHVTDPQKKKELAPYDDEVERGDYNARARYLDAAGVKRDQEQHEDGPKASEIPAWKRKEQGKAPLTTQDLDNERNQSRTTQKGLDAHKAKMGMSEELAAITKLAGLAK